MKVLQYIRRFAFLSLLATPLFTGCGKLDDLDMDDLNPFSDEEKAAVTPLRRYGETPESMTPLVEFIVDPASRVSSSYEKDVRKTCDYAKLPYRSVDMAAFNSNPSIAPTTRVVCVTETKKLTQPVLDKLVEFAAAGGTVFLPFAEEDHRMGFLFGFRPEAEFETDTDSKGFLFKAPILPNMAGKTYSEKMPHYGFASKNFGKNIKVMATAVDNPNYAGIVENTIGKGRVFLYNTSIVFTKIDRGLLFAGLLKGLEGIPYPIANTATIFLDDFPSPLYNIKADPIKTEMDLTITDFVKKVWWPDMQTLAQKYKMSYSAMIAFDYKNKVEPPFIFDQWNENKLKTNKKVEPISDWLVYNVRDTGHELAFHGYNHVSLQKGLWPNPQFIGMALQAVDKKWEINNFGPKPITYVPPSNIIDGNGVNYLKSGMPSLQYMCSLYLGDLADGGGREFDFDPYNKDMFDYPRISSGFYMDSQTQFAHQSMWLYTGIWTHFVHPDDVYQIPQGYNKASQGKDQLRNSKNLGWRKTVGGDTSMFDEFDQYLKMTTSAFPQTRFLNGGDAGKIVNNWRASRFSHRSGGGSYTVSMADRQPTDSQSQYWFVFASQQNAGKIENQLRGESHLFSKTPMLDGFLYSVYTSNPELTLRDLQPKDKAALTLNAKLTKAIRGDYKRYLAKVDRIARGVENVVVEEDPDAIVDREMAKLLTKMEATAKIDSASWNTYAKYLNERDRGEDIWKIYEEYCVKNPATENILYSKELAKLVYYPNELTREKWMSAQMMVTPNDKDLLNSYVADFYTPENQAKIRQALVGLLKIDTSEKTYLQYIEYLLAYDQAEALNELKEKKPLPEYQPFATDAVWLFANNGLYEKALEWSALSEDIDFASKMSWLIELKDWKRLEVEYKRHTIKNPEDHQAKATMANVYLDNGRFRDAWILTNSMPESPEKDLLRTALNKDVAYQTPELQLDLLTNHPELFLPDVLRQLTKSNRKENGDFVAAKSDTETNREFAQSFKNTLSYNHYDKKGNLHSFAGTYSTMYKINMPIKDFEDNVTHAVGGIQYQFTSPKEKKWQYWVRGRGEYSDRKKFFFQGGSGVSMTKDKNFRSAELKIFPTETGPAHSKEIYQAQLTIYQDVYFLKYFNASLSLEGHYYTKSKSDSPVFIEESFEGFATGRLMWDDGEPKRSRFVPFIEAAKSQASIGKFFISPETGYPYWMLDHRFNAGGGLGWKYGLPDGDLTAKLEAAYFYDDYSDNFQRFTGEVAWQIFDYTLINASLEVFAQDKFFSNNLSLGVKYNLKQRTRK